MTKPLPKAPVNGPSIYRDHDTLYLDFGTMVVPFMFTEGGLAKALKHIPNIAGPRGGHVTGASNISARLTTTGHIAKVSHSRKKRPILDLPEGMKEKALQVVKRRGMGKP